MTSSREAKFWMVAALAVMVWACTMVGCTATSSSQASGQAPEVFESFTATAPTLDASWLAITESPESAAEALTDEAYFASPFTEVATLTFDASPMLSALPTGVEPIRQPEPRGMGSFDIGLSGLSIARPLLSAKRLLIAGVTQLDRIASPWPTDLALQSVARAEYSDRPLAASLAMAQSAEAQPSVADAAWPLGQDAMLMPELALVSPFEPAPAPTPAMNVAAAAEEAKFDAAGIIGLVLGGMVLLFGGEAVVFWAINRRQAMAERAMPQAQMQEDEHEVSIFRIPEPIADDEVDAASMSRAA